MGELSWWRMRHTRCSSTTRAIRAAHESLSRDGLGLVAGPLARRVIDCLEVERRLIKQLSKNEAGSRIHGTHRRRIQTPGQTCEQDMDDAATQSNPAFITEMLGRKERLEDYPDPVDPDLIMHEPLSLPFWKGPTRALPSSSASMARCANTMTSRLALRGCCVKPWKTKH
jgi:hypothetical protein